MTSITRRQARENGDTYYFTGKHCKHNHVSIRFTSNGTCVECHEVIATRKSQQIRDAKTFTPGTRTNSLLFGRTFYSGKSCPLCGTNKRYTKSKNCVRCATHKMTQHEIKLLVIRFPHQTVEWYAKKSKRTANSIYYALMSLNIRPRFKPVDCVG